MPEAANAKSYGARCRALRRVGALDDALDAIRKGLVFFPAATELHAELGDVRLAREEYAWARGSYVRALSLDPGNEEAMLGLGCVLLRFGEPEEALALFGRVERLGSPAGAERSLAMARALYQEGLYEECRDLLARATRKLIDARLMEALAYALHRLGRADEAASWFGKALDLDPGTTGARIGLGHHLFDMGCRDEALREFMSAPVEEHEDPAAVWRVIQMLRAMQGPVPDREELAPWEGRLDELLAAGDPVDRLFAEIGGHRDLMGSYLDPRQLDLFVQARTSGPGPGAGAPR